MSEKIRSNPVPYEKKSAPMSNEVRAGVFGAYALLVVFVVIFAIAGWSGKLNLTRHSSSIAYVNQSVAEVKS